MTKEDPQTPEEPDGPTVREVGRCYFRDVVEAAKWCEKHPQWTTILNRADGTVRVNTVKMNRGGKKSET